MNKLIKNLYFKIRLVVIELIALIDKKYFPIGQNKPEDHLMFYFEKALRIYGKQVVKNDEVTDYILSTSSKTLLISIEELK